MSIARETAGLDATAQAGLVRSGEVTPTELVEAAIERIESLDPTINAVIQRRFERALDEAAGPLPDGPFRGVPILLKDLGTPMAGEPSHLGSELLKRIGNVAKEDSALTTSIREAGFVVLGRTNVPEFGLVCTTEPAAYGPTRNPWDLDRSTGGSSGGAAAAVAAGLVPIAQGTDGGGSIRMPASHCGLLGLKPTRGRISLAPAGDGMEGHTTNGFLTTSVRDAAAALDLAAGYRPGDAFVPPPPAASYAELAGQAPPRLRVGLLDVPEVNGYPVDEEVRAVTRAGAQLIASLGHEVEDAYPQALLDAEYLRRWQELLSPSVSALFEDLERLAGRPVARDEAEEMAWWWRGIGERITATQHRHNQDWRDDFTRRVASWWAGGFDLLVSPVLPHAAPRLGFFDQPDGLRRSVDILCFTPQFNTTGQPAMSVPLGATATGLPLGLHVVAAHGREDLLLQLAAQLEQAAPWADRRPPLHATAERMSA
ncbi:amidase [Nocardioides nitrophenolicus]|uniref:amidase n=1 Tax=Nocardioides nitrophenolicus TaxID=60489 RepID=UPI00195F1033|nr:amidase family protein [Nocardioides nitrophenolicus]MBM7517083.1 amidase [Nocardioides nitrophenolicus]